MTNEQLSKIIRKLRGTQSLRAFASKCGISHTTIDNLEKGVDYRTGKPTQIKLATLSKIFDACNVPEHLAYLAVAGGDQEGIDEMIDAAIVGDLYGTSGDDGEIHRLGPTPDGEKTKRKEGEITFISTRSRSSHLAEISENIRRLRYMRPITRKRLPMLGNVACGEPTFADEQHDTYVDAADNVDADFCLTAKGDSMINARIFDGDILFVKQQESVDDGEIAVVLIEDETTVKRVYYDKENNVITLMPENPTHKPMRFEGAKLDQIRILGKVVSGQYVVK